MVFFDVKLSQKFALYHFNGDEVWVTVLVQRLLYVLIDVLIVSFEVPCCENDYLFPLVSLKYISSCECEIWQNLEILVALFY